MSKLVHIPLANGMDMHVNPEQVIRIHRDEQDGNRDVCWIELVDKSYRIEGNQKSATARYNSQI